MPLHSAKQSRERILLMGGGGTGKTNSWLVTAKRHQQTKSEAKFYVIDSDAAVVHALEEEFPDLNNVVIEPVFEWPEYTQALDKFLKDSKPDDFIIVDMIGPAWDAVQEYFVMEIFGKNMDEFFMEARKAQKKGQALDGWKDYSVINRLYRAWMNKLIFKTRCHVICTSGVDNVSSDTDSKDIRVTFGPYGVKPRGQKNLPHMFHTILLTQCKKPREDHSLTTIKDRGREAMVAAQVKDFSVDYLVKVAGWRMV